MKSVVICLVLMSMSTMVWGANPYGIAGYGARAKLGMPADCVEYDWTRLHAEIPVQMVRPINEGTPVIFHRYDLTTKEAHDPAQFAAWVAANLGKMWVIGNEPDNPDVTAGDDMAVPDYVEFYHYYYTTISAIDPTARFAIAGCLGGSTYDRYEYSVDWIGQVMKRYKEVYGVRMPIDIWNVHSYCGPKQFVDPDKIITDFVTPFVNWCKTVENGVYANNEIWITELPVGEWMGACSMENAVWFMRQYMPRLERAGVDRWFWFVASAPPTDMFATVALWQSNAVTPAGAAYAELAQSYPNPIPTMDYSVPAGPAWFSDDFTSVNAAWNNKAGRWALDDGSLRQSGIYRWWGTSYNLLYDYQDFGVSFKMKINSAETATNWGGVGACVGNRFETAGDSGYLVLVRQNGELVLFNAVDKAVVTVPDAVQDPSEYHSYRVVKQGSNFTVWVDNQLKADWTDPNRRFSHGLLGPCVGKADCDFDDFCVIKYPTPIPQVVDGGIHTTSFNNIPVSWTVADIGALVLGYRYAVGTRPGASNIVAWTDTSKTIIDISGTFVPSITYYVSVKAVYPGGLEGSVGVSDGITPVVGALDI